MAQTAPNKSLGGLPSAILGVSIGMVGVFITVLSSSFHRRWVALDAEASFYGFPFPWLSKSLSSFGDLLDQARAPPIVNYSAFALDFLLYTAPLLALAYLLMGAVSRHRIWRIPSTLSSSDTLHCFAGLLSVLLGMTFVLSSLSTRMTSFVIDGEFNRYGSPLPWLSKSFGDAVLDAEGLVSQIIAPPTVDYQALFADLAFYMPPALAVTYGIMGVIHASQYVARRLWARNEGLPEKSQNGDRTAIIPWRRGPPIPPSTARVSTQPLPSGPPTTTLGQS